MANKADLITEAQAKGLTLTGDETVAQLNALLGNSAEDSGSKGPVGKKRNSAEDSASFEETVSDMKSFLASQPVVSIFVPLEPGEPKGTLYPVEMNGYKVKVPKNVYVDVPLPIAEIIKNSLNVYEEASSSIMSQHGTPMRLDLATGDTKSALNA